MSTPHEKALLKFLGQKTVAPRMGSKKQSQDYYKSIKNHKKRPIFQPKEKKASPYKKLTIEEYERKYLNSPNE